MGERITASQKNVIIVPPQNQIFDYTPQPRVYCNAHKIAPILWLNILDNKCKNIGIRRAVNDTSVFSSRLQKQPSLIQSLEINHWKLVIRIPLNLETAFSAFKKHTIKHVKLLNILSSSCFYAFSSNIPTHR